MINFRKTLLLVGIILLSLLSSNAARVYFDNSYSNWSTVYIYSWNGGTKYTGNWPGTQMYKLDGTDNIYYYDLSESSNVMVIFNTKITENGNEKTLQTGDLTFNENHVYKYVDDKKTDGCDMGEYTIDSGDNGDNGDNSDGGDGGDTDDTLSETLNNLAVNAYVLIPEQPKPSETATLYYRKGGNLANASAIYLWTWLAIQNENGTTTDPAHAPSCKWGEISSYPKYQMVQNADDSNIYSLTFTPSINDWFGVEAGETATKLGFIIRDASGNKQNEDDLEITLAADSPVADTNVLGAVNGYSSDNGTITFSCENGELYVTPYGPETVKIFMLLNSATNRTERRTISVVDTPHGSYDIEELDDVYHICIADGITVSINKADAQVSFLDEMGNTLLAENGGLINRPTGGAKVTFRGMSDGGFYGGGYNGGWTDWSDHTMTMNNTQEGGWTCNSTQPKCITIPFYVSTSGYGVYFDDHYRGATITPSANGSKYSTSATDPIAYYFLGGGTIDKVMQNYSSLTGRQPLPPYWALGYITSRYGYKSESEATDVINNVKKIGAPIDGLVFDLYWQGADESGMGNLSWYSANFPDGEAMMKKFKEELGVNTIVITEPFFTSNSSNYNTLKNKGYFADDNVSNMSWLKSSNVGLIDATNSDAMSWFADFYEDYTRKGMSGWWLDLGEPEQHDSDSNHQGGTVSQVHNEFGLLWIESVYNRLHEKFPNQRQFLMPRSGTAGMQHYASFPWTGDISRSWGGLQAQVPALVNSSMSGVSYIGADTGGFTSSGTMPNLYLRWIEFATFSPSMRTHSQDNPEPYQSCYNDVRDNVVKFINKRYSYLPYTYTLAYHNANSGTPLARPVNYYDNEPSTLAAVKDEYLWGKDILVAPVMTDATSRDIKFPDGRWLDLNDYTNIFEGGATINYSADLGTLPHFGRVGSVIPRFAAESYTNTGSIDHSQITLDIIMSADGVCHGEIYEDNKTDFDPISTGNYLLTDISTKKRDDDIDIILRNTGNGFTGMPENRTFLITVHNFTLSNSSKVFWGYNHYELEKLAQRRTISSEADGTMQNSYSSLDALKNASGDGYSVDSANNKTYIKVSVPIQSFYELTLGSSDIETDVEEMFTTPMTLSAHHGIFTYSAPDNCEGLKLSIYTTTGIKIAEYDGLTADGVAHQIRTDLSAGIYVATLTASNGKMAKTLVAER